MTGTKPLLLGDIRVHLLMTELETGARNIAAHSLYAASGYRQVESPALGRLRMAKDL